MKSKSLQISANEFDDNIKSLADTNPHIVYVFTSRQILEDENILSKLQDNLKDCAIVGCTTAGEMGEYVDNHSLSMLGMHFESTDIAVKTVTISSAEESYHAGKNAANELDKEKLSAVFLILPGLNVNGDQFIKGLRANLDEDVVISGGMAGDGVDFEKTQTICNGNLSSDQAIVIGFYGDNINFITSSNGGWKPFGPQRRVTKVKNNILYEIDGEPALALYKKYLGDKADNLPSSGLLYPFAIMASEEGKQDGLIRTILNINENDQSLIMAGDMEVNQMICLMHATKDELVEGAEIAANKISDNIELTSEDAVICVSCVGRKILMGEDTEDELDVVRDAFPDQSMTGFYSYGELSLSSQTNKVELHNQTMTITHISER